MFQSLFRKIQSILLQISTIFLISSFFHNMSMKGFMNIYLYVIFICTIALILLEIVTEKSINIFCIIFILIAVAYNPFVPLYPIVHNLTSNQIWWIVINSMVLADFLIYRVICNIRSRKNKNISPATMIYNQ